MHLTRLSSVAVSWRSTPLELLCASPLTLSNARTNAPLLRDFTWYQSSFVPGHHLTSFRAAPRRMMCCTTSVSGYQHHLLLTSPRRLLQVYLTLPLTGKQPHDLPPLRNAFVCPYAALATCISTGDLRLEIACVACVASVDPVLHRLARRRGDMPALLALCSTLSISNLTSRRLAEMCASASHRGLGSCSTG